MRTVVYDNLTRRERKHRHIAVADHLQVAYPDGGAEVAEVIADHLHQALDADPDAPTPTSCAVGRPRPTSGPAIAPPPWGTSRGRGRLPAGAGSGRRSGGPRRAPVPGRGDGGPRGSGRGGCRAPRPGHL